MASLSQLPAGSGSSNSLLSVIETAKEPLTSVPQCYVRLQQEPTPSELSDDNKGTFRSIPTIDMTKLVKGETSDFANQLEKLHSACKDLGIFQLVNHGVNPMLLENLEHEIEVFFKLPLEEKMKYAIRSGDVEGYGNIAKTKDQKLDWGDRNTLESYFMELDQLAMRLLGFMVKALKTDMREIEELFDTDGMQSVRMTYYPPCPQPELVVGLSPHSDVCGITILNQLNGVDGLQIKKDGAWMPVNFQKDAFVVNVGDIFEMLSNGVYKSIEHRAMVNSEKERVSVAMFFSPKFEAEIGPLRSLITPENPPLFQGVGMEKYVNDFFSRLRLDGKSYLEQMKI
ncbi:hypothetical protein DVH24_011352 [Malus domestica]|uniref:Fe2OG dioxygenase domain-containing protein n=1 Tax=Malus domestica TaxID=3750 RepID=A0A498JVP6_MALDO|nr:hypothetical protein DVH24_011352 [Malus domestica]